MHFHPNALPWLFLLIRAPETETDEFHFDFSAVLFERNNDRSRKIFFSISMCCEKTMEVDLDCYAVL